MLPAGTETGIRFGTLPARGIVYGNELYVVVGQDNVGSYSTDGVTWTNISNLGFGNITNPNSPYDAYAIGYGNGRFVAVGENGIASQSTNGTSWSTTNIQFATTPANAVAYGNGTYVVVGNDGKASYSTNGTSWTALTPGTTTGIRFGTTADAFSVTYGNGRFVVVGEGGRASYSTNGISWTALTPGADTGIKFGNSPIDNVFSVTYGNGKFVAVGRDGKASYSSDGITWTALTPGADSGIKFDITHANAVMYGNERFVVVGSSGKASYSADGIDWTVLPAGVAGTGIGFSITTARAITYGNGAFIVVGDSGKASIVNLVELDAPPVDPIAQTTATLNGELISIGAATSVNAYFERRTGASGSFTSSTTPVTLTEPGTFDFALSGLTADTLYNIRPVVEFNVGGASEIVRGKIRKFTTGPAVTDGEDWVALPADVDTGIKFDASQGLAVAYGNGVYVVGGQGGKASYSSDGANWTALTPGTTSGIRFATSNVNGIAYGNGRFVAVGDGGRVTHSTNGIDWTAGNIQFSGSAVNSVAFGNNMFVAVGVTGRASYSSDGITWTALTAGADTGIKFASTAARSVTYGNGKFVVVGASGKASYSTDGITWTILTPGADSGIKFDTTQANSVTYGNGRFVVVGASGKASYSSDGIDWTALVPGGTSGIKFDSSVANSVTYGNGTFIVVGASGKASRSANGIEWTVLTPGTGTGIRFSTTAANSIGYGNGIFIVVGASGKGSYKVTALSSFEAPEIDTLAADPVAITTATLNGELVSLGDADSVEVYFEWREGTDGPFTGSTDPETLTEPGVFDFELDDLTPDMLYEFRAVAEYDDGNGIETVTGATLQFTTDSAPVITVPDAPTGLQAAAGGTSTVDLSWVAPEEDGGAALMEYRIERSLDGITGWSQIDTVDPDETTFEDTGLTSNTEYFYRVSAVNSEGASDPSNVASAVTDAVVPTAETGEADPVTRTTATLNGTVSLEDFASASVYFEYGVGTFNLSTDPETVEVSGAVSADIESLLPGTLYQFRIVLEYEDGGTETIFGDTETFSTDPLATPDAPTDLTAVADGQTAIDLSWVAPEEDGGAAIEEYQIERSLTGTDGWGQVATTSVGVLVYSDTGLLPNTEYFYRVRAVNSEGPSDPSNVESATTDALVAPSVVTGIADPVGRISATLNATLDLEDYEEATVYFEYGIGTFTSSTDPELLSESGAFSADILSLDPNTLYQFRAVVEYEDGGTQTVYGDIEIFTTDPITVPDAPTNLAATATGPNAIDLSWDAPANDGGSPITEYRIERSLTGTGGWSEIGTTDGDTTEYEDTGLSSNTEYFYRVIAVNIEGAGDPSSVASATTDAVLPTIETGDADPISRTTATLNGTIDLGDFASASVYFEYGVGIFNLSTDPEIVEESGAVSADVENLLPGTLYQFRLVLEYEDGETETVLGDTETFTTDPLTVPGEPTDLSATADGTDSINLSWTAPEEDGGSSLTEYRIERSPNGSNGWTQIATTNPGTTTYDDTGLSPNTEYFYRVIAVNGEGPGDPSNVASATTDALTPPGVTTAAADTVGMFEATLHGAVTLGDYANVNAYFEYGIGTFTSSTTPQSLSASGTFDEDLVELLPGTLYQFRAVVEYEEGGVQKVFGDTEVFTTDPVTVPDAPTGLAAVAAGSSAIELSWTAPVFTGGVPLTEYRIERSLDGVSGWTQVATTSAGVTDYDDTELDPSTEYFYRVRAVNTEGAGDPSNVASATTDTLVAPIATTDEADAIGRFAATLHGTVDLGDYPSVNAYFAYGTGGFTASTTPQLLNASNAFSASLENLLPNTLYQFRAVVEYEQGGTQTIFGDTEYFTTDPLAPPAVPTGLFATTVSESEIDLSWIAPGEDGGTAVIEYRIERSPNGLSDWVQIATTDADTTVYSDTGLESDTEYFYRVRAVNGEGVSDPSNVASAITDTIDPSSPTPSRRIVGRVVTPAQTLASLQAQLQSLLAQLIALGGTPPPGLGPVGGGVRDLTIGNEGADVRSLQTLLINLGYSIPAGATGYFGTQTEAALAAYQAANGISPASGYFGPLTRAQMKSAGLGGLWW